MKKPIYIHYGSTTFHPATGFPIKNITNWTKPQGGLWASRQNATFGWKDWCKAEQFQHCDESNSFKFVLKDGTKVAIVSSKADLRCLPTVNGLIRSTTIIDFEECLNKGYDAIELCWYGDEYKDRSIDDMHFGLIGWDCDSIIVLNPEAIIQI